MKILSLNYRGMTNPSKKLAISKIGSLENPDILFLQETMLLRQNATKMISSSLPGWEFLVVNAIGKSGGIILASRSRDIQVQNSRGIPFVLFISKRTSDLPSPFI
jgi:exonuclease III